MKKFLIVSLGVSLALFSSLAFREASAGISPLEELLRTRGAYYQELYKHFHQHPELSGKEQNTSQRVAHEFRRLGLETTEGVGGFGVVGVLRNGAGPVGMVRGDMDALPIQEETKLPYASQNAGVMHACGHDVHTTVLITMAEAMIASRAEWSGTMLFVAQPAEEIGQGASAMLRDGLFERFPKPEYALALHAHGGISHDTIGFRHGPAMASADFFDVTFHGKDGHGAKPHMAVDPIALGAEFVLKLKSLVPNEVDATKPAVLNVGSFHAGTKHNIIPATAKIQVNMRTFHSDVRDHLTRRMKEIAVDLSRASRADAPVVEALPGTPSLFNNLSLSKAVTPLLQSVRGVRLEQDWPLLMTAEDFSQFTHMGGVPGVLYFVGVYSPDKPKPWPQSHTSLYAPEFLPTWHTSVRTMHAALIGLQARKSGFTLGENRVPAFTPRDLQRMLAH